MGTQTMAEKKGKYHNLMKLKTIVLILGISMLFITKNSIGQSQTNTSDQQIIAMLNKFYRAYITAGDYYANPNDSDDKIIILIDKYCSKKFAKVLKSGEADIDEDPFVSGNGGTDIKWLKTLSIHRESETKNLYNVSFLDTNNRYLSFHITVIKENGTFKIDDAY